MVELFDLVYLKMVIPVPERHNISLRYTLLMLSKSSIIKHLAFSEFYYRWTVFFLSKNIRLYPIIVNANVLFCGFLSFSFMYAFILVLSNVYLALVYGKIPTFYDGALTLNKDRTIDERLNFFLIEYLWNSATNTFRFFSLFLRILLISFFR